MATIIIFDPNDHIVPNRVTLYVKSGDTSEYLGRNNILINPDLSAVQSINSRYWKYSDGNIVAFSNNEKKLIDNFLRITDVSRVMVVEEDITTDKPTGGHYRAETFSMDIDAAIGAYFKEFIYPIPLSLLCMDFIGTPECQGDIFTISVAPNQIVGNITSNVAIGDTTFSVSQTVLDYSFLGQSVVLSDGTNENAVGMITSIDKETQQITTEFAATNNFDAFSPTLIKTTTEVCKNIEIQITTATTEIGNTKIGGAYLPAGVPIGITYQNITGGAKKFKAILEYLY